jgi:transcription antitermination factor NusG
MSTMQVLRPELAIGLPPAQWYALQTRPRHEKRVATELAQKGVSAFLPLVTETRQWSDRRMRIELPLFSCYLFVNIVPTPEARVAVLSSYGALGFVGTNRDLVPVPENQIDDVRRLVANKVPFAAHPFLKIGQRVRIRGGALDGIEGILERRQGSARLVISVQTIQRSLSLSIEGYDVEPVGRVTYQT